MKKKVLTIIWNQDNKDVDCTISAEKSIAKAI